MFELSPRHLGMAGFLSLSLLALTSASSKAACLPGGCHHHGLVFQEASPNFQITGITGTGSLSDPFVIHQDVWGLDISLAIDGLIHAQQHSVFDRPGFAISIVAHNLTGAFWRFYDHELQETAGVASHENDGLSFAQGIGPARPYRASHYTQADEVTDVRDFINFHNGQGVQPGEWVRFNYIVTDTIPNPRFFIRQRPDYRPNTTPTVAIQPQPIVPTTTPAVQAPAVPPITQLPTLGQPSISPSTVPPIPPTPTTAATSPTNGQISQVSEHQTVSEPAVSLLGIGLIVLGASRKQTSRQFSFVREKF